MMVNPWSELEKTAARLQTGTPSACPFSSVGWLALSKTCHAREPRFFSIRCFRSIPGWFHLEHCWPPPDACAFSRRLEAQLGLTLVQWRVQLLHSRLALRSPRLEAHHDSLLQ